MSVEIKNYVTKVTKETSDVGIFVKDLLDSIAVAMKDGKFDLATELPQTIMSAIAGVKNAIDGYKTIPEEFKTNPVLAVNGLTAPIMEGAQNLVLALTGRAALEETLALAGEEAGLETVAAVAPKKPVGKKVASASKKKKSNRRTA